jgi:hypothetical protein
MVATPSSGRRSPSKNGGNTTACCLASCSRRRRADRAQSGRRLAGRDRVKGVGMRLYIEADDNIDEVAARARHAGRRSDHKAARSGVGRPYGLSVRLLARELRTRSSARQPGKPPTPCPAGRVELGVRGSGTRRYRRRIPRAAPAISARPVCTTEQHTTRTSATMRVVPLHAPAPAPTLSPLNSITSASITRERHKNRRMRTCTSGRLVSPRTTCPERALSHNHPILVQEQGSRSRLNM